MFTTKIYPLLKGETFATNSQGEANMAKKLTVKQRKWLVVAHVLCVVAWLGAAFCSVVLGLAASSMGDMHASYIAMDVLDRVVIRTFALGTLITGILLSVFTHWGLFRFYWIIVKEVLSLSVVLLGFFLVSQWIEEAVTQTSIQHEAVATNHVALLILISLHIAALTTAQILSIWKPWGQRKRSGKQLLAGKKAAEQVVVRSNS
jgi:hypothetical protein